jgi:hypothetical protein
MLTISYWFEHSEKSDAVYSVNLALGGPAVVSNVDSLLGAHVKVVACRLKYDVNITVHVVT